MTKKKSTEIIVDSDHRKNFVSLLNKVAQNHNRWDVFSDFLKVTALAISNSDVQFLATDQDTSARRERNYLATINKYDKDERMLFPKMIAELVCELDKACQSRYVDVLGELFHSMDFQDKWKDQFFTPQSISDMAGKILISTDKAKDAIDKKGFVSINEPCCGSGSMILGGLNAMREYGLNPCTQALVVANDLDIRCVYMTYIQLSLYGIPAIVLHQNTLTTEMLGKPWYTPIFTIYGWKYKMKKTGIC